MQKSQPKKLALSIKFEKFPPKILAPNQIQPKLTWRDCFQSLSYVCTYIYTHTQIKLVLAY